MLEKIVDVILPSENVSQVRKIRKENLEKLSITEKVNYKLHDKTTWASIGLIGYFAFTQNWGAVITEVIAVIGG